MSLIPFAAGAAALQGLNFISSILFGFRSIGEFVADVTIEETAYDEIVITEHPVERSANITDHAYKRPVTLTIRAAWSNSSPNALLNPNYVRQVYEDLIALQESFGPFTIITGKRIYDNMLARRITNTTDEKSEYSLPVTFECQEVILTQTQTVTMPPAAQQKTPSITNPAANLGSQNLGAAPGLNSQALPT